MPFKYYQPPMERSIKHRMKKIRPPDLSRETSLVHAGRDYSEHGFVNPPVFHGSTVLFPDTATLHDKTKGYRYARRASPTSLAIEEAVARIEGGYKCKVSPSGLAAITTTLLAFLKAGDHLLMVDTVYEPIRHFCDTLLKGFGVETTYYDPLIAGGIAALMKPETRLVYCESPGSLTMEVQDVPAIAKAAHERGSLVCFDNTWSGGYYLNPFAQGCDISVQAGTKYLGGHSDVMAGTITCTEATWPRLKEGFETMGQCLGPDDMFLLLRGLRTLEVRLERHQKNALVVAEWLRTRPEVATVLYPALSNAPGHELWKRDFTGASGLFSVVLQPVERHAVDRMLDSLTLFGMGASWGGYESLVLPFKPNRTARERENSGPYLRFHIGLESPDDLIADLAQGLRHLTPSA